MVEVLVVHDPWPPQFSQHFFCTCSCRIYILFPIFSEVDGLKPAPENGIPETELADKSDKTLCHCDDRLNPRRTSTENDGCFKALAGRWQQRKFQDRFTLNFPRKYQNLDENTTKDLENNYLGPRHLANKK